MGRSLKERLRKNEWLVISYDYLRELPYRVYKNDEKWIKKWFVKKTGRSLDLENPLYYNDKLQWLKLNWRDPDAKIAVDKYKVREFVENKIGSKYLNELIDVYGDVKEIEIDVLPKKFVLKGTHGSGFNLICKDKKEIDWPQARKEMRRWMRTNYYLYNREWVYKDIRPRIICEAFLQDAAGKPPMDYKIFCFNGEPKFVQVDIDRFGQHKQNFYDTNWDILDIEIWCDKDMEMVIEKPKNFDEMLRISRILSAQFPHVRVDLYNLDGKIIFGELTFFHLSGMAKFRNAEFESQMGAWLDLKVDGK
ncbi:ATP-grasp fold amidoligase family protein [Gottschalkiaceae bacterium SANA]|nr:ATP-grasp fold amidoligase family protein [Gottschalkiaceae bacterium SANA]